MGGGGNMFFGFLGFSGTLLMLALIAFLAFYLFKRAKGQPLRLAGAISSLGKGARQPVRQPALQVLDERLASGQIEVEDYVTRRSALLGVEQGVSHDWTPQEPGVSSPVPSPPETDSSPEAGKGEAGES